MPLCVLHKFCSWLTLSIRSRYTDFFFANCHVYRSDCDVYTPDNRACPIPRLLLVGYFHYVYIEKARRRKLEPRCPPIGYHNEAGWTLSRKKLSKATPDDWSRDPYLVCLLLSLAQSQARSLASPPKTIYLVLALTSDISRPLNRVGELNPPVRCPLLILKVPSSRIDEQEAGLPTLHLSLRSRNYIPASRKPRQPNPCHGAYGLAYIQVQEDTTQTVRGLSSATYCGAAGSQSLGAIMM